MSTEVAAESPRKLPTLADRIEEIGFGLAQFRYVVAGGGVWFADGAELLLISAVTSTVATEWDLNASQRGSMVTVVYMGVCAGNLVAGPIGDKRGRRQLILVSYACIFIFSIMSSFMWDFLSLVFVRFFVGLSFGLGQPPVNALAVEITPSAWRVFVNTLFQAMFPLGEMYSASLILMDDPSMKNLNWRRLLQLGALPALGFFILAAALLPQSPFFLAQQGKKREAREVLAIMQHDNSMPVAPLNFSEDRQVAAEQPDEMEEAFDPEQYNKLLQGPLLPTTVIMSFSTFSVNFAFYGALYAFAQILPHLKEGTKSVHASAGAELLVGAFWEVPGYFLAMAGSLYMPRKLLLKTACFVVVLSVFLFLSGAEGGTGAVPSLAWHTGYYLFKCIISCLFCMDYVYIGEVYPTSVRSTGSSINIAFGRLGAVLSPLVYESSKDATGDFAFFFYLLAGMNLINGFLIDFLPIETYGTALTNDLKDLEKYSYGATDAMETTSDTDKEKDDVKDKSKDDAEKQTAGGDSKKE